MTIVTGDGIFIPPSYHQQTHPLYTKYNLLVTHLSLPQTYIYEKGISAIVIGQNFFKIKVKDQHRQNKGEGCERREAEGRGELFGGSYQDSQEQAASIEITSQTLSHFIE